MEKRKCKRCGFEWIPRIVNPKACPNCKRYDWDTKKENKNGK